MSDIQFFEKIAETMKKSKDSPAGRVRKLIITMGIIHNRSSPIIYLRSDDDEKIIDEMGNEIENLGGTWELKTTTEYCYFYEDNPNTRDYSIRGDRGEIEGRIRQPQIQREIRTTFPWLIQIFEN